MKDAQKTSGGEGAAMYSRRVNFALLFTRIAVGIVFFAHGGQKVFGWFGGKGLAATVDGMTKMGMPAVVPYLVAFGELTAGLGLIVGLLTRIAAGGMFIEMLGAVLIVHWRNGFFAENRGFEYPLTLCLVCLALMFTGAGAYSLDALLHRNALPTARPAPGVAGERVVIPGRRVVG
jgi:putative oxidoreductase